VTEENELLVDAKMKVSESTPEMRDEKSIEMV